MAYVVVKKPFQPKNDFVPWELVEYSEESPRSIVVSASFKRGDIFALVRSEHVSDVENNVLWIGIAVSKTRITPFVAPQEWPTFLPKKLFSFYQEATFLELSNLLPAFTALPVIIRIAIQCFRAAIASTPQEAYANREFKTLENFIEGKEDAIVLQNMATENYSAYEDDHELHAVEGVTGYLARPLVYETDLSECVDEACRALDIYLYENGAISLGRNAAIRFQQIVPLSKLLLSYVEKKPIIVK